MSNSVILKNMSKTTSSDNNQKKHKETKTHNSHEKSNMARHDAFVKKVLENPIAACEFLDEFLPAEFRNILDLNTLKIEKESYVEDSLKTKLSDIIYSAKTKPNAGAASENAFVYCIIEHVRHEVAHIKSVTGG